MNPLFILKAIAANQFARWFPAAYMRRTNQTGRGGQAETPAGMADYCFTCVEEYCKRLRTKLAVGESPLDGMRVLELGPGDHLGTALILYAMGATHVVCIDRFPLLAHNDLNVQCYTAILARLTGDRRARALAAFQDSRDLGRGFLPSAIEYRLTPDGTCGENSRFDLILSRAVLEYVPDLRAIFADGAQALSPKGLALHLVDLRGLTLDNELELDFLRWPVWLYRLMGSHKGVPNRWRIDRYREAVAGLGLEAQFDSHFTASMETILAVRPLLAAPFRDLSDDDLSCLAFWLMLRRAPPRAANAEARAP